MGQWFRLIYYIISILILVIVVVYGIVISIRSKQDVVNNVSTGSIIFHTYPGAKLCDETLSMYYDQFLLCLQSIPNPELLNKLISDDVNERDKCNNKLNRDTQISSCLYRSNYRFVASTCSMMIGFNEKNAILRGISEILCIKEHESLVSSGDAALNFRRQFDGSSFVICSGNYDCPSDEFCSIQGAQRCEKIVSNYYDNVTLVDAKQMEIIIRDNDIKSSMESHSRINSVTLMDGRTYIVRDVSVDSLILKYNKKNVQQWIE